MEIPRDTRAYRPLPGQTGNRARQAEATDTPSGISERAVAERRRQSDRRRSQKQHKGPDRRRRQDRRRPLLLEDRHGRPGRLEDNLGRNLDTRA
ncbi:MAG: hypothetical protein R3296_05925 [Oleiphilaceae bacterium]|nr:hypothetical protein [Oleiphilaceae bacterium]